MSARPRLPTLKMSRLESRKPTSKNKKKDNAETRSERNESHGISGKRALSSRFRVNKRAIKHSRRSRKLYPSLLQAMTVAGRRVTRRRLKSCQAGVWARTEEPRLITSLRRGWKRRRQRESVDPLCQLAGPLWSRQSAVAARTRRHSRRCHSSLRNRGEIQLLDEI